MLPRRFDKSEEKSIKMKDELCWNKPFNKTARGEC